MGLIRSRYLWIVSVSTASLIYTECLPASAKMIFVIKNKHLLNIGTEGAGIWKSILTSYTARTFETFSRFECQDKSFEVTARKNNKETSQTISQLNLS